MGIYCIYSEHGLNKSGKFTSVVVIQYRYKGSLSTSSMLVTLNEYNVILFCNQICILIFCDFKGDVPVKRADLFYTNYITGLRWTNNIYLFHIKHTLPHCFCIVTRCFSLHCCIHFSFSCFDDWRLRPLSKALCCTNQRLFCKV